MDRDRPAERPVRVKHDIVFLAGHFSANDTLAADFSTDVVTTEVPKAVQANPSLFTNTLVFSAGCHSGYNLQDQDAIPNETLALDWAQALTQAGATLVAAPATSTATPTSSPTPSASTPSWRRSSRRAAGRSRSARPLLAADQDYLAGATTITGIDQKAYLEATLYGIPTKAVNETGGRNVAPPTVPAAGGSPVTITGPGSQLGLTSTLVTLNPATTQVTKSVDATNNPGTDHFTT